MIVKLNAHSYFLFRESCRFSRNRVRKQVS